MASQSLSSLGMATAAAVNKEAAQSKLDAQLTCSVCLDRYVDPRALTCHHSFCNDCISLVPQEREQGRLVVKCPCCRESTQLSEKGPSTLPVAFYINNLLEIDETLKKTPASAPHFATERVYKCFKHNRSLELYCETCEDFICFKCGTESHQHHQYDEFAKYKQEIKSCLRPVNKRIEEVTDWLALFDVTEKNIKDQNEIVKEDIVQTIQEIADNLQRSKQFLLEQAERVTHQKLQLNSLEREEAGKFLAELKRCKEFVEEELNSRSQYQIQAANKSLMKHIWDTYSKVKKSKLEPSEKADTSFMVDRTAYTFPIGSVVSSLNSQAVCDLASVSIPPQAFAGPEHMTCVPVVMPISMSPEQVTTTLSLQENIFHPSVVQIDEEYLVICLQPRVTGLHELSVCINGIPVKGSPFMIPVLPSAEMREQGLDVVASGLKCPYNSVVTEDGQQIVVVEMEGSRVTVLTTTGQVVRRFGRHGQGPGKFVNPHSVAVSSSNHIFVADIHSIQKFTFSGSYVAIFHLSVRGLVFHPNGRLLAIAKNHSVEIFNLDLSHSHSLSESKQFVDACDLAVDTKGMVYVLTIKHGIHCFSSDLKHHIFSIDINDQFKNSCLVGICVDTCDNIYVTDVGDVDNKQSIIMLTAEGECVAKFGDKRHKVHGIAVNKTGDVFVCCFSTGELVVYRA